MTLPRSAVMAIWAMMTSNFPAWMPGSNPSQALSTNVHLHAERLAHVAGHVHLETLRLSILVLEHDGRILEEDSDP